MDVRGALLAVQQRLDKIIVKVGLEARSALNGCGGSGKADVIKGVLKCPLIAEEEAFHRCATPTISQRVFKLPAAVLS